MKKKLSLTLCLCFGVLVMRAAVVSYTPDNTTIFKNPERGYTEELSYRVRESHPNVVKGNLDSNWGSSEKMSLAMILYNFQYFQAKPLPQEVLNGFDEDMQILRESGVKCVLRFAYTESESNKKDAVPDTVKLHLEQLKPYLAKNADVIYVLEAGFIGSWGEWYYTTNYGNESQHVNSNRRKVIQYLMANVPTDRFILFRYPMIQQEYLHDMTPLTPEEGFSGTEKSRMGCHNDAFLNNWGNDGTYASDDESDDPQQRQYIATHCLYTPNGGETNVESNSLAEKVYTKAPEEMATYHWSFCGKSYATQVTSRWRSSGIFDTLNIHMGYRYNLLDGQFSDQAAPGGKANVTICLRNVGYAPIYNERPVYLVVKGEDIQSAEYKVPLQADPRRWLPNGVVSVINEQIDIPATVPPGRYHLYLWMPDKYQTIRDDSRFAVRMANENVWNAQTGYNDLGTIVTISNSAPLDPGPLPESLSENRVQYTAYKKTVENGVFYVVAPNGQKYTVLGQ